MADIKDPRLLWLKAILFLLLGLLASVLILVIAPDLKIALLLVAAIWSFCRLYYFAFYVIEHYIDPTCKFAGLTSVVQYMLNRKCDESGQAESNTNITQSRKDTESK